MEEFKGNSADSLSQSAMVVLPTRRPPGEAQCSELIESRTWLRIPSDTNIWMVGGDDPFDRSMREDGLHRNWILVDCICRFS